jgi:phosphoglycerate kinase
MTSKLPLMQDLNVKGKKVLLRVDFNVPLDKEGLITDNTRIKESIPTIQWLLDHGAAVILLSHLGRPKQKEAALSLKVCAKPLENLLGRSVLFLGDDLDLCKKLKAGDVALMENLRFNPAEEKPELDPDFAKQLASCGDIYVNDAFATAHRAHTSTALIAEFFPKKRGAGFLLQKEIQHFEPLLKNPKHPFFAIIGGAKVSSKLGVLKSLIEKVDAFFIGGGMAYTFFKSQGIEIGDSIFEPELVGQANDFLETCKKNKTQVFLPIDLVIADRFAEDAKIQVVEANLGIPKGWQGMDIGPKTLKNWQNELTKAKTVFWNGPVGVFEFPAFARGTKELSLALSSLHATTIVGGGDSVAAINQAGLSQKFTHVSTGGGAALEYLEFGKLPGIEALRDR